MISDKMIEGVKSLSSSDLEDILMEARDFLLFEFDWSDMVVKCVLSDLELIRDEGIPAYARSLTEDWEVDDLHWAKSSETRILNALDFARVHHVSPFVAIQMARRKETCDFIRFILKVLRSKV